MGCYRILLVAMVSFIILIQNTQGWGEDGHAIVCKIAQVSLAFDIFQYFPPFLLYVGDLTITI
jgi:hypothetical protein